MSLLAELKRRKVVRVGAVYAATGFAVLQAADILAPALRLPEWTVTMVVAILALGCPVALGLAWVFELSADGLRRTLPQPVPAAATQPWLGRRTVLVVGALVLFGSGLGAGWFIRPEPRGGAGADRASLAVLPFENLSRDDATAPFVAGLHDDLLTRLSGVGALRVIARASVRQYEGSDKPLRLIAQELGVATVMAGGVQRAGDHVRINVQLIDGTTGEQLWAQRFDRDLTAAGLFGIQTEITDAIARSLSARLTDEERSALGRVPTGDVVAYELFLRGRAAFEEAFLGDKNHRAAIDLFREAAEKDPSFAEAWAQLAIAWMHEYYWRNVDDVAPARDAVRRARALDPGLADAALAQALIHYYGDLELRAALAELSDVRRGFAGSAAVLQLAADLLSRLGRTDEALATALRSLELDPRSPAAITRAASFLGDAGRFDEATTLIEGALVLAPRSITLHLAAAGVLAGAGDWDGATRRMHEGFRTVPGGPALLVDALLPRLAWIDNPHHFAFLYELDEFREALVRAEPADHYEAGSYHLAVAHLHAREGRPDRARVHYEAARAAALAGAAEQRRVGRPQVQYYLPQFAFALAGLGRFDEAVAVAEEAVAMRPLPEDAWDGQYLFGVLAAVLVLAGEHDRAIDLLEQILARRANAAVESITPGLLRHAPIWAPLRSHPRFERLVRTL